MGSIANRNQAPRVLLPTRTAVEASELLSLAETIYRFRRLRDEVFGGASFSDPRWDMLLDLFIARERGRRVSVSSACIAAAVPPATALRHLGTLVAEGLVRRAADAADARVVHVELTDKAYVKLRSLLAWRLSPAHV